jgi:hypothetical protein
MPWRTTHFLTVIAIFAAGGTEADAVTPVSPRSWYLAELARQCPGQQLFPLDEHDLREVLDQLRATLPADQQAKLTRTVATVCSAGPYPHTPRCDNDTVLGGFSSDGHLADAASWVCETYTCNDQSDCKRAARP